MAKIDLVQEGPTAKAVDAAHEASQLSRHSPRLGGSDIGEECDRAIWYKFRWVFEPEVFTAAKLRIFRAGHRIEAEMVADLKRALCTKEDPEAVRDLNPATGKQWATYSIGGHFVSKCDGFVRGLLEAPATDHVLECKSHKRSSYTKLEKGVALGAPKHFAQMQTYMLDFGLTRAFYMAECKDDSARFTERVRLDANFAMNLKTRAERIINAPTPPPKAWESPDEKGAFPCSWCKAREICHEGGKPVRNCRTCLHSTPEMTGDAVWTCARHRKELTWDEQRVGCPNHLFIPALVPGEILDANEQEEWVEYRMHSGQVWRDGVKERAT
jgi:hypothetical protein